MCWCSIRAAKFPPKALDDKRPRAGQMGFVNLRPRGFRRGLRRLRGARIARGNRIDGRLRPPERFFKIEACPETDEEFVWVYRCEAEGPFQLHPDEIERGGWFTPEKVTRWMAEKPEDFAGAFRLIWEIFNRQTPDAPGTNNSATMDVIRLLGNRREALSRDHCGFYIRVHPCSSVVKTFPPLLAAKME